MISHLCCLWLALQGAAAPHRPDEPLPELGAFLQGVRARLRSDRLLLSQYTYTVRSTERHLDGSGAVKKTEVDEYEVYPSLEEEETYRRFVTKNSRAVPASEIEKADRDHARKLSERTRKLEREGTSAREKRLANEDEEKRKDDEAIDEMFRLYEITMVGRERIDRFPAIALDFRPRPGFRTRTDAGKVLRRMAGRAWFHERDHEMIRLDAELIEDFSIGMGLLARLNKGAHAVFERRLVNDEIWLPAEMRFTGSARILLFKGMRLDVTTEISGYKKFTVETSVQFPSEKAKP